MIPEEKQNLRTLRRALTFNIIYSLLKSFNTAFDSCLFVWELMTPYLRKLLCTSHYFLLLDINQSIKEMDFTSGTKSIQTFDGFALPSKYSQCTEYQLPGR